MQLLQMKQICKTQFWNSFLEERGKKPHHAVTKLDFSYVGNLSNTVVSRKQGVGSTEVSVLQSLTVGLIMGFNTIELLAVYRNCIGNR